MFCDHVLFLAVFCGTGDEMTRIIWQMTKDKVSATTGKSTHYMSDYQWQIWNKALTVKIRQWNVLFIEWNLSLEYLIFWLADQHVSDLEYFTYRAWSESREIGSVVLKWAISDKVFVKSGAAYSSILGGWFEILWSGNPEQRRHWWPSDTWKCRGYP